MFDRDYLLKGKHATYTKYLRDTARVFNRYIDVYMVGSIVGLLHGRTANRDSSSTDTAMMFAAVFIEEKETCQLLYRLIMLLDTTTGLAPEQRLDRAFREDSDEEALKRNMALFNSFVLGGIEVLYEKFSTNCTTSDDYLNMIFSYVDNFKNDIEGITDDSLMKKVLQ